MGNHTIRLARELAMTTQELKALFDTFEYCYKDWEDNNHGDRYGVFETAIKQQFGYNDAIKHQFIVAFYYDDYHPDYCVQFALASRHIVTYKEFEDMLIHAERNKPQTLMGKRIERYPNPRSGYSEPLRFEILD